MCSFFSGEKFDLKIDEFVKKFEDRLADIEDKEVLKTKFWETDLWLINSLIFVLAVLSFIVWKLLC